MDRNKLIEGVSIFGLGVILYFVAMELPSILQVEGIEVVGFLIRVISYVIFVIGAITIIISIIPEHIGKNKKFKASIEKHRKRKMVKTQMPDEERENYIKLAGNEKI